ncbi:MAG TPA: hypothetical protein VE396_00950 [Xanthobacteraceae bacterium]|jgi:hypothetical protein|nr:hypothetical protein [Xanthobacteraceae bacterium]
MAKGRPSTQVEFIRFLAEMLGCKDYSSFARRIGKKAPNVHNYYNGKVIPKNRFLLSALRHTFEWEVTPILEVQPMSESKLLTTRPGIYCLYDSSGSVIYVGQATNLKQEIGQALQRKMNFPVRLGPTLSKKTQPKYKTVTTHLSAYEVSSPRMRHNLEALLLRAFPNQSHNNKMGNLDSP